MKTIISNEFELIGYEPISEAQVPFYMMNVAAGIPVPVESELEETHLDMNEFLVEHPSATFFARMNGDSNYIKYIKDNDVLVIDSAIDAKNGDLVIVDLNNNLTIRYYKVLDAVVYLESDNAEFLPMNLSEMLDFKILGVVRKIIHSFV